MEAAVIANTRATLEASEKELEQAQRQLEAAQRKVAQAKEKAQAERTAEDRRKLAATEREIDASRRALEEAQAKVANHIAAVAPLIDAVKREADQLSELTQRAHTLKRTIDPRAVDAPFAGTPLEVQMVRGTTRRMIGKLLHEAGEHEVLRSFTEWCVPVHNPKSAFEAE